LADRAVVGIGTVPLHPMLQTADLQFSYATDGRTFRFPDITAEAGQTVLVTGQSGCGKTTLLHLLAGILRPQAGSIRINDNDIQNLSEGAMDRFRGQHIGMVYQKAHFVAALTIKENLLLAPFLAGKKAHNEAIEAVAQRLGIGHTLQMLPARLSIGEQQRASIVRALINQPKLILADEPTSALDDTNCAAVIELLRSAAAEQQAALVVVTHDGRLKDVISDQVALSPT
jgi:ABC-type lipoprotein export system ATPase subunit